MRSGTLKFSLADTSDGSEDCQMNLELITQGSITTALTMTDDRVTVPGGIAQTDTGVVTQTGSITSGVTLNANSGVITTVVANTGARACQGFTVSNSRIAANDAVFVKMVYYSGRIDLGQGIPFVSNSAVGSGSFTVQICNGHASNPLQGFLRITFFILHM